MNDSQYYAHRWLSRMRYVDAEIRQLDARRQSIISSMSGIGKYDAEHVPTQNGENSSESKLIEFSIISEQYEKKIRLLSFENGRTLQVIEQVKDAMLRGILLAKYINGKKNSEIGKLYNYERTRTLYYINEALEAVCPFIPEGEVFDDEDVIGNSGS